MKRTVVSSEPIDQTRHASEFTAGPCLAPAQVVSLSGPGAGAVAWVDGATFVIGRSRETDLTLDDPAVSRAHAEIRLEEKTYFIVDAGSRNGIRLNGRQMRPSERYRIEHRDVIELGGQRLLFLRCGCVRELGELASIQLDREKIGADASDLLRKFLAREQG